MNAITMKKLLLVFLLNCFLFFNAFGQMFQWAKIQGQSPPAIASDGTNTFSAAVYRNSIVLGNDTLTATGSTTLSNYLAKHDQTGAVLWAKNIGGAFRQTLIEVDKDKNILVIGEFTDSLYIDSLLFTNPPTSQWGPFYYNFFYSKIRQQRQFTVGKKIYCRSRREFEY